MNKTFKFSLVALSTCFLFSGCLRDDSGQNGAEVSISGDDLKYVPTTSNQLDDKTYLNNINDLLEQEASAVYDNPDFINLIKAIAWTESKWEHYFKQDDKYYVMLGDSGHSYGIMQIYDSYHGKHPVLQDNIEYGANFAYTLFEVARSFDCLDGGSNAGTDSIAIARRTYAQYNGGSSARCRNANARDDALADALSNQVWNNYL